MANTIIWNARPAAEIVCASDDVATAGLRNATTAQLATGIICPESVENGTGLFTQADFLLKLHKFDDVPHAGDNLELHIVPEFGTLYGDGEHGDLGGTFVASAQTLSGVFPLAAANGVQHVPLVGVPLPPHDFKVILKGTVNHDISDTDGSFLYIYRYCPEVQ